MSTESTTESDFTDQQDEYITNTQLTEDDYDILTMTLPLRPGTDTFSKTLLREKSIKDIIISTVIGKGITGDAYVVGSNEQLDGRRTDSLYLPLRQFGRDLPPVIVEAQKKVDQAFIIRAIRYCLNAFEDTKSLPILVVISINGFSSKKFRDTSFTQAEGDPFYTHPCQSWATKVWVYTPDSISNFVDKSQIDPMLAISYVLMMQQPNIIGLGRYNDPAILKIYKTALSTFSVEADVAKQSIKQMQTFCDAVQSQFKKILRCEQDTTAESRKRLRYYAEDGMRYAEHFKRQYLSTESGSVTPIENAHLDEPSADLIFVNNKRSKAKGRFNWNICFDEGQQMGLFNRYRNHITLQRAFANNTL
ncbi:hypothetical protein RMATCC62417_17210 [Rhizopus microsporus]|nr:hypothetical protein RMATCC62417_16589 [Rhizopus microsporus]CEG83253.1 hypothetical protein RMATCC62417_17210 [Rhizopus microsporus]